MFFFRFQIAKSVIKTNVMFMDYETEIELRKNRQCLKKQFAFLQI